VSCLLPFVCTSCTIFILLIIIIIKMHLYFARSRQSKIKQTKNRDKYIAREITQYQ